MSQQNPLELAKQGNPNAIAALINRNLKPKGITAKVSRKDDCLRIMLESNEIPKQGNLVEFIRSGILKLGIAEINTLQVFGRQIGSQVPAWSQTINLKVAPSLPLTTNQQLSEPQNLYPQPIQNSIPYSQKGSSLTAQNSGSVSSSGTDSASSEIPLLREAAQKGDLQAISSLIGRAITPRNIPVEAEIQYGVNLWLKIYPVATMQPQSCIQAVIRVLNDIQPDKVRSVTISEIASDKKTQVWNKFLALKNGKFVDNTTSFAISTILSLGIFIALIIGLFNYCALPKQPAATVKRPNVSSTTFQGEWMLTVDSGELLCETPNTVIFIAPDGTKYAVNGIAKSRGYADIQPIWKDNPQIPGTKINIGSLIDEGLKLCK